MALMVFRAQTTTSQSMIGAAAETFVPFSATRVRDRFLRAAPQSRSFGWIGPRPRITRRADGERFTTTAVWIGAIPPDTTNTRPFMAGIAEPIAQSIKRELDTAIDTWTVEFTPYSESVHGSLDQWRTGAAADTRTENQFDLVPTTPENPLGMTPLRGTDSQPPTPSRDETQRPPVTPVPPRVVVTDEEPSLLLPFAIIFVPVGLAWGLSYASETYGARSNPSRRRHRRF